MPSPTAGHLPGPNVLGRLRRRQSFIAPTIQRNRNEIQGPPGRIGKWEAGLAASCGSRASHERDSVIGRDFAERRRSMGPPRYRPLRRKTGDILDSPEIPTFRNSIVPRHALLDSAFGGVNAKQQSMQSTQPTGPSPARRRACHAWRTACTLRLLPRQPAVPSRREQGHCVRQQTHRDTAPPCRAPRPAASARPCPAAAPCSAGTRPCRPTPARASPRTTAAPRP